MCSLGHIYQVFSAEEYATWENMVHICGGEEKNQSSV
jgi:hypothetical protein